MLSPSSAAPGKTIRVVLADDHEVVRSGLRMLLGSEADIEVVAEAGDGDAAARYVLGHKPDVLVLDVNMPGGSGLDAIAPAHEKSPDTKVVILTMEDDAAIARQALQAGALGFVLKDAAEADLVTAVRLAAEGKTFLQPALGAKLASEPAEEPDGLSDREREVLALIAMGNTNAEVAEQLFLSIRTVESHRARVQQKLDLSSRAELVRYALDHGLMHV